MGCATTARVAVEAVEGVTDAEFSYERAEGFVRYDTTRTDVSAIITELERKTPFGVTERERAGG